MKAAAGRLSFQPLPQRQRLKLAPAIEIHLGYFTHSHFGQAVKNNMY
jgi:hypothetical protein